MSPSDLCLQEILWKQGCGGRHRVERCGSKLETRDQAGRRPVQAFRGRELVRSRGCEDERERGLYLGWRCTLLQVAISLLEQMPFRPSLSSAVEKGSPGGNF